MRVSLAITSAALLVASAPGASQPMPPMGPMSPMAGPILAYCPTTIIPPRRGGRILGIPIPGVPPMPPMPGLSTPSFGGTTSASISGGAPVMFVNRWASAGKTGFSHVIEGPVGPVRIILETCSDAGGGETVAIYPADSVGQRVQRKPRYIFSIANRRGNVRYANAVIAPSRRGAARGTIHMAVIVENASGRFHSGAYRLTVGP